MRIIVTAPGDRRPAVDVIWPGEGSREIYKASGLEVVEAYRPLGREDEPFEWANETTIAPWGIYYSGHHLLDCPLGEAREKDRTGVR